MNIQSIEIPCPICHHQGEVKMITHIDEIPYFGEHTQLTLFCEACSWKQTDSIPAEGKKSGAWRIKVNDTSCFTARVVRSSSCTVRIHELDLEVNPGASSTGYVSNIEGVIQRFLDIIDMVGRDLAASAQYSDTPDVQHEISEHLNQLQGMKERLLHPDYEGNAYSIELLDPHGHSMILHDEASERELTPDEIQMLPVGPDPAVFSSDEL